MWMKQKKMCSCVKTKCSTFLHQARKAFSVIYQEVRIMTLTPRDAEGSGPF